MKAGKNNISNHQTQNCNEFSHLKKLEYFRPDIVRLNLPFILTEDKILVLGMPYLKLEGEHVDAVRLLDVWDKDGYVHLKIEDLNTGKVNVIFWLIDYNGDFWLWALVDIRQLGILKDR